MDRWKATALVLIGVVMGLLYGSSGALSAFAGDSSGGGAAGRSRTIVYLDYEMHSVGVAPSCPAGASYIGFGPFYTESRRTIVCALP